MSNTYGQISVTVAEYEPRFHCEHDDGDISLAVAGGSFVVYLHGTPAELEAFAEAVMRATNGVVRTTT